MSENESAGEKTEQTEKRLRDAREQGNLPRSRELAPPPCSAPACWR
jgi:flagellar biosynthetic protein FlhB